MKRRLKTVGKRKAETPFMKEWISITSKKILDGPADVFWISNFDLDYAYVRIQLSEKQKAFACLRS